MGLLSYIYDFLSTLDGNSYVDDSKEWADNIWSSLSNKKSASLSLYQIDQRLYKRLRVVFRNGNIAIFTNDEDRGWYITKDKLSRAQRNQINEQGYIVIKKFNR